MRTGGKVIGGIAYVLGLILMVVLIRGYHQNPVGPAVHLQAEAQSLPSSRVVAASSLSAQEVDASASIDRYCSDEILLAQRLAKNREGGIPFGVSVETLRDAGPNDLKLLYPTLSQKDLRFVLEAVYAPYGGPPAEISAIGSICREFGKIRQADKIPIDNSSNSAAACSPLSLDAAALCLAGMRTDQLQRIGLTCFDRGSGKSECYSERLRSTWVGTIFVVMAAATNGIIDDVTIDYDPGNQVELMLRLTKQFNFGGTNRSDILVGPGTQVFNWPQTGPPKFSVTKTTGRNFYGEQNSGFVFRSHGAYRTEESSDTVRN